ncbi:hypothetical protein HC928_04990 [bacterium]|nr:hypothetical protein [bacterium]
MCDDNKVFACISNKAVWNELTGEYVVGAMYLLWLVHPASQHIEKVFAFRSLGEAYHWLRIFEDTLPEYLIELVRPIRRGSFTQVASVEPTGYFTD